MYEDFVKRFGPDVYPASHQTVNAELFEAKVNACLDSLPVVFSKALRSPSNNVIDNVLQLNDDALLLSRSAHFDSPVSDNEMELRSRWVDFCDRYWIENVEDNDLIDIPGYSEKLFDASQVFSHYMMCQLTGYNVRNLVPFVPASVFKLLVAEMILDIGGLGTVFLSLFKSGLLPIGFVGGNCDILVASISNRFSREELFRLEVKHTVQSIDVALLGLLNSLSDVAHISEMHLNLSEQQQIEKHFDSLFCEPSLKKGLLPGNWIVEPDINRALYFKFGSYPGFRPSGNDAKLMSVYQIFHERLSPRLDLFHRAGKSHEERLRQAVSAKVDVLEKFEAYIEREDYEEDWSDLCDSASSDIDMIMNSRIFDISHPYIIEAAQCLKAGYIPCGIDYLDGELVYLAYPIFDATENGN